MRFFTVSTVFTTSLLLGAGMLSAQAKKPAAPKSPVAQKTPAAPAAAATPMGKILEMLQAKMPEPVVLKAIESAGPLNPTPDDFLKLKAAGASDAILTAVSGTPASSPAAAPAVKAEANYNTDFKTLQCQPSTSAAKRVVAIDEFDFGTVRSNVAAIFGTQVDIGKGILALMTKRLAEEGKYRIVERQNLQKVLSEQDLGASNRVKQGTQAKIGRVQGADAILMGTITVFGQDTRRQGVNTSALGIPSPRVVGGVNIGNRKDKAVVAISYRLIDAESSEVIAVGEARGESQRTGNTVGLGGLYGGRGGAVQVDMTSSNFLETVIGEATLDCVNKLAAIANANENRIARRDREIEARIAEVDGPKVYLAAGSNDGIQNCDRLQVSRIIKEIKDPSTGEVLDLQTETVGELMVVEVREKISIAYFNGTSAPQVGYVARKR